MLIVAHDTSGTYCPSSSVATAKINVKYANFFDLRSDLFTDPYALGGTCALDDSSHRIYRADLFINAYYTAIDPYWYSSYIEPIDVDKVDLESTLTHELGHALGANHFVDSGACGDVLGYDADDNTMCPVQSAGESVERSIEAHDVHTIEARY